VVPSGKLTYPTWGKGTSSSDMPYQGDMLVPWRVRCFRESFVSKVQQVRLIILYKIFFFFPACLLCQLFFCLCVTARTRREFDAKVKMFNVVREFVLKCHSDVNSWYIMGMILMLTHHIQWECLQIKGCQPPTQMGG